MLNVIIHPYEPAVEGLAHPKNDISSNVPKILKTPLPTSSLLPTVTATFIPNISNSATLCETAIKTALALYNATGTYVPSSPRMRLTSALSIRNLLAKLHPPHAPTPRESQQLLSVLQNSFSRRLDDAYPSPQRTEISQTAPGGELLPDVGSASATAANAHLQSVLSHPSLEQKKVLSRPAAAKAGDLFDAAVIQHRVNSETIKRCTTMYWDVVKNKAGFDPESALGPKIAAWLTSSEISVQEGFLTNIPLMSDVLRVMYHDAMEATVWDWLKALYESGLKQEISSDHSAKELSISLDTEDRFVALMVQETLRGHNLNAAVLEYAEACEYRASRPVKLPANTSANKFVLQKPPLTTTGGWISTALLLRRKNHHIPAELYDRLLQHAVKQPISPSMVFWAFIPLYHPTAAECRTLYLSLHDEVYVNNLISKIKTLSNDRSRKAVVTSILDGAELMLELGPLNQAQFILEFAEKHFPTVLPSKKTTDTKQRIQHAREEVRSAQMSDWAVFS